MDEGLASVGSGARRARRERFFETGSCESDTVSSCAVTVASVMPTLRWASILSFAVPFALAMLCAGNGMGFYDSPEIASAGAGLGVTHPPGHPLFVILAAMATMIPVGAVPLRIALLEATCLGILGWLSFQVAHALARRVSAGVLSPSWTHGLALASALVATVGPGVVRQSTRVEVYALAAVLAVSLLALASRRDLSAWRARVGLFLFALGVANHHFIMLTAAPLLVWIVLERWRQARCRMSGVPWRFVVACGVLFLVGLVPYALLPLRADAPASLPRVRSFADFIEVVSARVFVRNTGGGVPGSAGGRMFDVLDWFGESVTPVGLLFALGGLYVSLRVSGARTDALRLLLLVGVVSVARAWLGFVRNNPDAAGYLVPAIVALGIASVGFSTGVLRALRQSPPAPRGPSRSARVMLFLLLVGGPVTLPVYLTYASVRASAVDRTYVPETLAVAVLGPLPPRCVLFVHDPQMVFRLGYATLVEGERPDVTVVPVPLLGYPGMVASLLARDAALRPLMTHYLLRPDQGLPSRGLSSLAMQRPVALEIDPRNVQDNVSVLLPRGLVAQVTPEPTTLAAVRGAAAAHFARMDQLAGLLERASAARELVDEVLLWRAYNDALFFAARGARAEARHAVANGLARAPTARELIALQQRLMEPGEGPVDITAFLTRENR